MHLLRIFQLRNVIIWLSQQWHVLSSSTCLWWLNVSEGIGRPAKRRAILNEDCLFRSQEAEEANIPEGSRNGPERQSRFKSLHGGETDVGSPMSAANYFDANHVQL